MTGETRLLGASDPPGAAAGPPALCFVILLVDENDAQGLVSLLDDMLVPDVDRSGVAFRMPPNRGVSYFADDAEAVEWRARNLPEGSPAIHLVNHDEALPAIVAAHPGRFFVGYPPGPAPAGYKGVDAKSLTLFAADSALDFAAQVMTTYSQGPPPHLFDPADAERMTALAGDLDIQVLPGGWDTPAGRRSSISGLTGVPDLPGPAELPRLSERLDAAAVPSPFKQDLQAELDSIEGGAGDSSNPRMLRRIEFIVALPWDRRTGGQIEVRSVREALDVDHYGMQAVKDATLEYVAVLSRRSRRGLGLGDAPKLCLLGPPGVGKTTIARSIAKGLGRPFTSLPLGGCSDAEALRGWDRAYIGSSPGAIMRAVQRLGTKDGVVRVDEIEKTGRSERGNPLDVLLEVFDPDQNCEFRDQFIDIPFDLSEIFFIATANDISSLDPALRDRLEVVTLRGYTPEEKLEIVRRHILPALMRTHCLEEGDVILDDEVLPLLVGLCESDPGVRQIERFARRLLRKSVLMLEEGSASVRIDRQRALDWLGTEHLRSRFGFAGYHSPERRTAVR